ncbi:MAG: protein kinase, partial [Planctomycetota bacterium]|nr:protein kinase [Planctomycetota bacterium]
MSQDDLTPDFLSNLRDLVRNKDQEKKGQRIGHFILQEQLGQGGMAVVYLAEQENLGRKVAVKLLKRVGDDRARAYFDREAKTAASLDHPHIAKIFEVGEHEGAPFIAMQFIEGETFSLALLTMDMHQRVRAVLDMARALEYAHSRKVIHRDLKPDNILVDRQGQVFVTDFGLAKMESAGRAGATASSVVAGTPAYMAPEQARAKADAQSDLYSLGAILYQCMTGQPPFLGRNASEVLVKVLEEDPSPPRQLNASVPEDLEAIIMKALEKKKEHRYRTATELVEDLDAFVSGKPVRHARRATLGYVIGKLLRRQPVLWSLAAGLLLAIGLGSTIGVSLFSRAEEESTKRQQLELRRKLEARIDPLRKKIEDTRFFFYIANVDIREKLEGVRASLEEVVSIMESPENSDFAVGWRTLGVGYYFIGDRIRAEKYLKRSDELSPNNRVTNQFLGKICLDRAFQFKNGDLGSEPEERGKKSVFWAAQAKTFLEKEPGEVAEGKNLQSHVARAYLSWLKNDIPQLIKICDQSLVQFRKKLGLEEFWNLKGMVSQEKDQEENYTQAISHCPHYAWGYYMRANSLFHQGKMKRAAEDFTKAIEINPRHPDSFNGRGVVHWRLGRMEEANKDFSEALLIDGDTANYWNNR